MSVPLTEEQWGALPLWPEGGGWHYFLEADNSSNISFFSNIFKAFAGFWGFSTLLSAVTPILSLFYFEKAWNVIVFLVLRYAFWRRNVKMIYMVFCKRMPHNGRFPWCDSFMVFYIKSVHSLGMVQILLKNNSLKGFFSTALQNPCQNPLRNPRCAF